MPNEEIAASAATVLVFIKTAMNMLSHRAMTMLAMSLGAGISLWAAAQPDVYRTILAIAWWPLVYWPALWAERKSNA